MKCTIIGHNGFTDFFSQYALYKEKISKYDDIIIFVNEESTALRISLLVKGSLRRLRNSA